MATSRGTRFVRDYKDQEWREPGEGYNGEEPQKGMYPFRLVDVREHETSQGNESVHWTFEMTDDAASKDGTASYAGWRGHLYTNDDTAAWKEQQIMVALGAIRPNGKYNGTLEGLLKKYGKVVVMGRVIRERFIPEDGGEGEWRAKLVTVIKGREEGTTRRGRNDVDDEPDVDTDEDDEEEPAPPPRRSRARRSAPEPEPEPEPDEDEDGEEDLDALAEELEKMTMAALKKHAKEEFGLTVAEVRGLDKEDLIEKILEVAELPEDEDEPEEEPVPPPRRAARAGKSSTRSTSRTKSRSGYEDEPPF